MFRPESGAFLPLPKLATEPFLKLWEQEVFALLLREGKITEDVVANIRSWKHSGFSVDQSVRLEAGDAQGIQRLIQYFLRCPISQAQMNEVTEAGKVIYKTDHNAVGRFPEPGDEELSAGPSRNFQVFDPLDFLAEVTQHIPDPGAHLVRYSPALWAVGRGFSAGATGGGESGGLTHPQQEGIGAPRACRAKSDGPLGGRLRAFGAKIRPLRSSQERLQA